MLLYLHIPFCDSKCSYCAFNSYTHLHSLREKYMQAIVKQLAWDLERFKVKKSSIKTLFIGGGTPSTVQAKAYETFFELLNPYLKKDAEITTEANPNSATKEWLEGMKNLGVNRISFGTQSFDAQKLAFLNRSHSAEDTKKAVNTAFELGIKNLSIDLIYATSIDSKALLKKDLKEAFSLPINHLSAYALTIEEGTAFFKTPSAAKEIFEETQWFVDAIQEQGLAQYEISNFGSYQSAHNRGYWEYENYLGIGSGAVGCVDSKRYYPSSDVQNYIDKPLESEIEMLSNDDIKSEKILLGLRSCVGFDSAILETKEHAKLQMLLEENKLRQEDKQIYNSDYFLADELALFILG